MANQDYDFERYTIQDSIHGAITFGVIEKAIIDHPLFQRLHGLRQNSLLYLIFPSANHTRFDHSVGVMCLVDKFLAAILKNQRHICNTGTSRPSFQDSYRVDDDAISSAFQQISDNMYYRIMLRTAALLHDIGHGPLSHLFDKFFPSWTEMKDFTGDPDYDHIQRRLQAVSVEDPSEPIRHEVLSCVLATRVILDCTSQINSCGIDQNKMVRDVCAVIDDKVEPTGQLQVGMYNARALFHDILSSDIDVDRMDYLLRDSKMCGVNYGLYDPDRILKSMCAYARVSDKCLRVGVRYSGLGALEDLLVSRYQMHGQIYGHKTNRACNAMLQHIRERLKEIKWKWYQAANSITDLLNTISGLTDQKFIQMLLERDIDDGQGKVMEIAKKLFIERKLYRRVYEGRSLPNDGESGSSAKQRWVFKGGT